MADFNSNFPTFLDPSQVNQMKMERLLQVLAEEFPQYHSEIEMQAQAGMAIATMIGSVGAWVMLRSSNPELSLDKFIKMINAGAKDMAFKGYPLLREHIKKHGFRQEPS